MSFMSVIYSSRLTESSDRRGPTSREQLHEDEPRHEPADVRHVGDATPGLLGARHGADTAHQLEDDPEAEHHEGGNGHDPAAREHLHLVAGEQQQVSAEDAADG